MISVKALDHIVLNVGNVEKSAQWYQRVLGMNRKDYGGSSPEENRVSLRFGNQRINLRPIGESQERWFTGSHPRSGGDDLCFLVDSSPQTVVEHLNTCKVPVELGPLPRGGALGTILSIYCRDPDGNLVELSSYPSTTHPVVK